MAGVPCFLYDAEDADAFGDCCDTLGVTAKPLWFYAAVSLPIEIALVALAQREDGSIGERRTRRETAVFAFLTLFALVLIVLRVVLPDENGDRVCEGGWECYQAVVFAFTNSSALITCLVLWVRVEFKRHFWAVLKGVKAWLKNPAFYLTTLTSHPVEAAVDYVLSAYGITDDELRDKGREGTTKAAEHYFAMFAVLGAGGLTHALPSLLAYAYLFLALLLLAVVTHALRVGPLKDRTVAWTLVTPVFVVCGLALHAGLVVVIAAVAVAGAAVAAVGAIITLPFLVVGCLRLKRKTARAPVADGYLPEGGEEDKEKASSVASSAGEDDGEVDDFVDRVAGKREETPQVPRVMAPPQAPITRPVAEKKEASLSRSRARASSSAAAAPPPSAPPPLRAARAKTEAPMMDTRMDEPERPYGGGGGEQESLGGMQLMRAGSLGDEPLALRDAEAPEPARKQKQAATDKLVKRLQWVLKEIKKVVLFDPLGHVVVWGGALMLTSFALAANYSLLLYSGAPYAEAPVVDFFARDSGRFVECYGSAFSTSFAWQTSLLGILELALFAFGVGGILVQVGTAVVQF